MSEIELIEWPNSLQPMPFSQIFLYFARIHFRDLTFFGIFQVGGKIHRVGFLRFLLCTVTSPPGSKFPSPKRFSTFNDCAAITGTEFIVLSFAGRFFSSNFSTNESMCTMCSQIHFTLPSTKTASSRVSYLYGCIRVFEKRGKKKSAGPASSVVVYERDQIYHCMSW